MRGHSMGWVVASRLPPICNGFGFAWSSIFDYGSVFLVIDVNGFGKIISLVMCAGQRSLFYRVPRPTFIAHRPGYPGAILKLVARAKRFRPRHDLRRNRRASECCVGSLYYDGGGLKNGDNYHYIP